MPELGLAAGVSAPREPFRLPELPPPEAPAVPAWPGALERLGGLTLHVRRTPRRAGLPPAVYVHGLGGSATNWTDLMYLLADRFAGTAPDLPGFGLSPPPAGGYRLSGLAATVAAVIAAEGPPVHLFGNSLGGAVATVVAARRPELVRTLTLISPALPVLRPSRDSVGLPLLLVPGVRRLVLRHLAGVPLEDRVQQVIALCFADPAAVPPGRVAAAVAEARERAGMAHADDALAASTRALLTNYLDPGADNLWRLARRVSAPTLLVFGREDRLVGVRIAPLARQRFRDARLVVLPGVGHVAMLERPAAVAGIVLDWMAELARRG